MTKGNYNRQQVFFECGAGAVFLLSHNQLPTSRSDYHAAQTPAFLCRTLQFVIGRFTHGQLAPVHHDGGGFIPVCPLLDAQLFHSPPKVAWYKRKTGRQTNLQTGQVAGKKVCKGGTGRGAVAAEIKVEAPAENVRECSKKCSKRGKTYENQRICEDFKADAPDCKFRNARQAAGVPGRSEGRRDGGGRGRGGSAGRSDRNIPMGRNERGILGKGGSV
jgi:hypothetical protein